MGPIAAWFESCVRRGALDTALRAAGFRSGKPDGSFIRLQRTRKALAERIGIHVVQMRLHEVGASQPTLDVIRKLPEAYRETLLMRLVEGMGGAEIAERSGLTPASVRVNLHRGMKLLREKLGRHGNA